MSAFQEFSDAQQFFLVFAFLSAPVFLYFYFRATLDGTTPALQRGLSSEGTANKVPELGQFPLSSGFKVTDAEAPLPRESIAKPVGSAEPGHRTSVTEGAHQRDEMFPHAAVPRTGAHDIVILPLIRKPSAVKTWEAGFPAKPRYQVPGGHSFQIVLEVKGLLDPEELAREMAPSAANEECRSLIAEIGEGETVGLILECLTGSEHAQGDGRPIDVDTTYQAFALGSRPVTALFMAHARAVEGPTNAAMALRVMAGGVETGRIEFEITVDPAIPAPPAAA